MCMFCGKTGNECCDDCINKFRTGDNQFIISLNNNESLKITSTLRHQAFEAAERIRKELENQEWLKREEEARIAREKQEQLKKRAEAILERERQERLKKEEEARLERERQERLKKEEEARLERERQERLKKEEDARLERERQARLKKEKEARLERERQERLKIEEEARLERERQAREKREEAARLERERQERIRRTERNKKRFNWFVIFGFAIGAIINWINVILWDNNQWITGGVVAGLLLVYLVGSTLFNRLISNNTIIFLLSVINVGLTYWFETEYITYAFIFTTTLLLSSVINCIQAYDYYDIAVANIALLFSTFNAGFLCYVGYHHVEWSISKWVVAATFGVLVLFLAIIFCIADSMGGESLRFNILAAVVSGINIGLSIWLRTNYSAISLVISFSLFLASALAFLIRVADEEDISEKVLAISSTLLNLTSFIIVIDLYSLWNIAQWFVGILVAVVIFIVLLFFALDEEFFGCNIGIIILFGINLGLLLWLGANYSIVSILVSAALVGSSFIVMLGSYFDGEPMQGTVALFLTTINGSLIFYKDTFSLIERIIS